MRLTVRILGTEVLHVSTEPESAAPDAGPELGDATSSPMGFSLGYTHEDMRHDG